MEKARKLRKLQSANPNRKTPAVIWWGVGWRDCKRDPLWHGRCFEYTQIKELTMAMMNAEARAVYPIYRCDREGNPLEMAAVHHTVEEVLSFKKRPGQKYVVFAQGRPMTLLEFKMWAAMRE
jgi:hypothetical protein